MRGIDAAFLAMERDNEPRHLGSLMIFGPSDDGPLDPGSLRRALAARLPAMPSARRVVAASTTGLTRPSWRTVERVDLDVHLRHTSLDGEQPQRGLHELVAALHATRLDRDRPLWQMHVIDGLPDGRVAVYAKVHMAAIDDQTGVGLMTALLDDDPGGRPTMEDVEVQREAANSFLDRTVRPVPDQVRRAAGFPGRMVGRSARVIGEQLPGIGATAREVANRWPGLGPVARLLPGVDDEEDGREHPTGRAPRLSFNEPIGPRRVFAAGAVPMEQVVAVRDALSGSVPISFHSLALAVCTGALRRWLSANDELPTSPIVAVVPVLVRGERDADAHVAGIMLALPTHMDDPLRRLETTAHNLAVAKGRYTAMPVSLAQDLAMFTPPPVASLATRLNEALPHRRFVSPTVNLGITNVPGPRRPVYLAGRPLLTSHPVLSVSDITPLHLGVQAAPATLGFGAIADGDTVDELDGLIVGIDEELAELATLVP